MVRRPFVCTLRAASCRCHHLPVGEVALAGSARGQIALWCYSQHNCVGRDSVTNKTRGATCPPQERVRRVAAAESRCGVNRNIIAGIADSGFS